jgi:hypothetical protein
MSIDLFGPTIGAAGVTTRPTDARSFGTADTFFNDCSSATADDGTEYQAAFFNAILANWRSLARGNGQTAAAADIVTQDNTDDSLILKAVQQLIQRGVPKAAQDTGTAGHVVAAFTPAVAEHKFGLRLSVQILNTNNTNGGATDFAPNTLPALPIKRIGGDSLQPGDLRGGGVAELFCMGPGTHYEIVSFIPPSPPGASTTKAPKLIGLSASGGGTSIPVSTNTQLPFTIGQNNLWGTSTFTGSQLTVGAGEAGLWYLSAFVWYTTPASGTQISVAVRTNGNQLLFGDGNGGPGTTGGGNTCSAQGIVQLNVGDVVTVFTSQEIGSTMATTEQILWAYLVSAY